MLSEDITDIVFPDDNEETAKMFWRNGIAILTLFLTDIL
jgi:hypothetical protein